MHTPFPLPRTGRDTRARSLSSTAHGMGHACTLPFLYRTWDGTRVHTPFPLPRTGWDTHAHSISSLEVGICTLRDLGAPSQAEDSAQRVPTALAGASTPAFHGRVSRMHYLGTTQTSQVLVLLR